MRPARLIPTMSGKFSASVRSLPGEQHNIPNFALALQIGGRTGRTPQAVLRSEGRQRAYLLALVIKACGVEFLGKGRLSLCGTRTFLRLLL